MKAKAMKLALKHASPTFLTILSIVGVISTAILSSKATLKYKNYLDEEEKEKPETKNDILVAAKIYAPAIAVGAGTILGCVGANYLNTKRIAGLTAGYALITKGYKDFENKAEELIGKERIQRIKELVAIDSAKEKNVKGHKESDDICTYYESFRDEFFEVSKATLIEAEYAVNRMMASQGFVSLNTFYDYLGLEPIDIGDEVGWSYGVGSDLYGYSWVDFEHHEFDLEDGMKAIHILFPYPPDEGYMK